MKILIEQLENYYQSAISNSQNERLFFLCIADYVKFISENKKTVSLIEEVVGQSKEHYKKLQELADLSTNESKTALKKLKTIVKKKGIHSDKIDGIFSEIRKYELDQVRSTQPEVERVYHYAREIINEIKSSYPDEVKGFYVTYPENDEVKEFTFSEHYMPYNDEVKTTLYLEEISLWSAWEKLLLAYQTTYGVRELLEYVDSHYKDFIDLRSNYYYDSYKDMKELMEGSTGDSPAVKHFKIDDYSEYLVRTHNYLLAGLRANRSGKMTQQHGVESLTPRKPERISTVEIRKGATEYQVLINDGVRFKPQIKKHSSSDVIGYWDLVYEIADKGYAEAETRDIKNICNYLNGKRKDNPLFRDTGLLPESWVKQRGYRLEPCDDVKIGKLSEKRYHMKFKKAQ